MTGKEDAVHIYTSKDMCVHTHTHTHTMEYYSAIEKNESMSFVVTWINLEIIKLSEANQTEEQIYDLTYVGSKKMVKMNLLYKTELDSQTQKTSLQLPKQKGWGRDNLEAWH